MPPRVQPRLSTVAFRGRDQAGVGDRRSRGRVSLRLQSEFQEHHQVCDQPGNRRASQQHDYSDHEPGSAGHSIREVNGVVYGAGALARVEAPARRLQDTILPGGNRSNTKTDQKPRARAPAPYGPALDSLWDSRVWIARGQTADAGIRAGAELPRHRAVAAQHGEGAASRPGKYNIPLAFDSAEDMCRSPEVDAVLVTTPNACHLADVLLALRCGKPVLCENRWA